MRENIADKFLNSCLEINRLDYFLSGKLGTKLSVANGTEDNYPQDYLSVVHLIYSYYTNKKYNNIDIIFEAAILKNSMGDMVDLISTLNIILIQLDYEKRNKAPFKLKNPKKILNNLKSSISVNEEKIKNVSSTYWNDVQYVNNWLKTNDFSEIVSYSK